MTFSYQNEGIIYVFTHMRTLCTQFYVCVPHWGPTVLLLYH